MITEYTAKDAPAFITLNINANNSRSQGNHQYTDINDDVKFEAGNNTEIPCKQVTLLLKVPESNNARNATRNLLQDFLVQIQQRDSHVTLLSWYFWNNNSSEVPIEWPANVSKDFQALKTYYPCINPKTAHKTAIRVWLHLPPPLWWPHPSAKGYELLVRKWRTQDL